MSFEDIREILMEDIVLIINDLNRGIYSSTVKTAERLQQNLMYYESELNRNKRGN